VLLEKGFGINDIDSNHGTALQAAIYMNHIAVIDVLLDPKRRPRADVNTPGGYYGCALQVAAFKGSAALIQRLLDLGADVSTRGGKYNSVLQAAARTGLPSILQLILNAKPQSRAIDVNEEGGVYGTALQAAAKGDYSSQTIYLRRLSRGRVLRQATRVRRTTSTESTNYLEVAKMLVELGAVVIYGNGRLGSPINAAASSGKIDMLEYLVSKDRTPRAQRRDAYSYALISAITQAFVHDRLPLVRPLVETQTSVDDRLLLVRMLVENGADFDFEVGSGLYNRPLTAAAAMNSISVVQYLLEKAEDKNAMINAESGIYGSALRAALSANAHETAIYLIKHGAGTSTNKDSSFGNVLHLAVFSNMKDVVELLLRKGDIGVNLSDEAGQTALHIAAYRGYEGMVATLLRYGAEPDRMDAWGDTPLKIVEDVIERESHPGPSLKDLRKIKQHLLEASGGEHKHKPGDLVHGPPITKELVTQPGQGTAKPVYASPIWNPGLSFKATIVDFFAKCGDEYLSIKTLSIDDLLYRKNAVAELMPKDPSYARNLRWYHIPSNNVSQHEMWYRE
jgi:ankyrin repeat protein